MKLINTKFPNGIKILKTKIFKDRWNFFKRIFSKPINQTNSIRYNAFF
jgi:hypothetical protein